MQSLWWFVRFMAFQEPEEHGCLTGQERAALVWAVWVFVVGSLALRAAGR